MGEECIKNFLLSMIGGIIVVVSIAAGYNKYTTNKQMAALSKSFPNASSIILRNNDEEPRLIIVSDTEVIVAYKNYKVYKYTDCKRIN